METTIGLLLFLFGQTKILMLRDDTPVMFTLNDLPNWMTIMRIAITPLIAVLIWIDKPVYGYQLALALYTIASVTDYIDGYMARRLKVESPLGEMLDDLQTKRLRDLMRQCNQINMRREDTAGERRLAEEVAHVKLPLSNGAQPPQEP